MAFTVTTTPPFTYMAARASYRAHYAARPQLAWAYAQDAGTLVRATVRRRVETKGGLMFVAGDETLARVHRNAIDGKVEVTLWTTRAYGGGWVGVPAHLVTLTDEVVA